MKKVNNDDLILISKDENLVKLKNNILRRFVSIDRDDGYSLYLVAAWKALGKYDEGQKTKFSTYFCSIFYKECLSHLKSLKKHSKVKQNIFDKQSVEPCKFNEYMELVPEKYGALLYDRFVLGLTLKELGKKYDRSYEVMRRRLKKAIKILREVMIEN